MREFIKILADIGVGVAVLAGGAGVLLLVLGAMVLIEGGTSDGDSAFQAFISADNWLRGAQMKLRLEPTRILGSYGIGLGTKLLVGSIVAAAAFDIMYSLRTLADHRRR